jgi:hypothetical protein
MAVPIFAASPLSWYGTSVDSLALAGQAIQRDADDGLSFKGWFFIFLFGG